MKVLFIGGTGVLSSACAQLAVDSGIDLWLLNRGRSFRALPAGAQAIAADIRDPAATRSALGGRTFDVVVDFIAFTPAQVETDIELFRGRCRQYVFISSASVYQPPPALFPITESTPLCNPHWDYSRQKIAGEERLLRAWRDEGFPVTIVRPSHTYDASKFPLAGGWTAVKRLREGRPAVVHGDGTTLWTLTHHRDFAKGLVPLLGNPHALGEAVHITSDEALTWDQIHQVIASAVGGPPPTLVHVPSDTIAAHDAVWGAGLLGDKGHCKVFDNAKIRRLVPGFAATIPYHRGVEEVVAWHLADPARQVVDERMERLMDVLIARQRTAMA